MGRTISRFEFDMAVRDIKRGATGMEHARIEAMAAEQAALERVVKNRGERLNAFPKWRMGLTLESVKETPEWREASRLYSEAFNALRDWNAEHVRDLRKLAAYRKSRIG